MGVYPLDDIVYSAHRVAIESDHASTYVIELEKILDKNNDDGVFSDIMHFYKRFKLETILRQDKGEQYFEKAVSSRKMSICVLLGSLIGIILSDQEIGYSAIPPLCFVASVSWAFIKNAEFNLEISNKLCEENITVVSGVLSDRKDVKDSLYRQKETLMQEIKEYRDNLS